MIRLFKKLHQQEDEKNVNIDNTIKNINEWIFKIYSIKNSELERIETK